MYQFKGEGLFMILPVDALMDDGVVIGSEIPLERNVRIYDNGSGTDFLLYGLLSFFIVKSGFSFAEIDLSEDSPL